ncbi:hypothetical protein FPQ18DRAFT_395815 [Pyronema domesticum]|nr:hypothetical protein FPQ18DRAFT_395815 [Pyronema domesticum]
MEKRIQKFQEENKQRHEELVAVFNLPRSTPDMEIQQLKEQKEDLTKELKMLRKENTGLQNELDKVGQDGPTKDMAKLLKRYYEMEDQFAQMKKEIKQDVKNVLAEKEKKTVQQVQGHLVENGKKMQKHVEKRLGETENHVQQQVEKSLGENEDHVQKQLEERLTENEKQIQQLLGVNEVTIWRHG